MTKRPSILTHVSSRFQATTIWLLVGVIIALLAILLSNPNAFLDLNINLRAGTRLIDGEPVFGVADPVEGLLFSHTPFAAVVYGLFSLLGGLAPPVWTVLSLVALTRSSYLLVSHMPSFLPKLSAPTRTACVASLLVVLSPFVENLRLGQISIFLLWTVCEAFFAKTQRTGAVLLGVATAMRLTPLGFIALLPLIRRTRDAVISLATTVVCTLVGFAVLPSASIEYFGPTLFEADRVGGAPEMISNQSINGLLWRLFGPGGAPYLWLMTAGAVILLAWYVGRRNWQLSRPLIAVGAVAIGILLASPVSWDHHWVIAAPVGCGLWILASDKRNWPLMCLLGATYLVFLSRIIYRVPHYGGVEFSLTWWQQIPGNAFVITGGALLAVTVFTSRPSSKRESLGKIQ